MTHRVSDHDEFDTAARRGWLSPREAEGARTGLHELIALIERRELVAFLAGVHPFDADPAPPAPDKRQLPLAAVPMLRPGARPSW